MNNRSLRTAAASRRGNLCTQMVMVVRGKGCPVLTHRDLRQAELPESPEGDHFGHDYSNYGQNPMAPRPMLSEPPPGEPKSEQHGDLVLVVKHKGQALVVDPRQHYLVITMTGKDWWEGARKDLGAIGREKALRALDRS